MAAAWPSGTVASTLETTGVACEREVACAAVVRARPTWQAHAQTLAHLICGMVMRFMGSTTSIRMMRSRLPSDSSIGSLKRPALIFLNKLGMDSSSNGRLPHSSAYLQPGAGRQR